MTISMAESMQLKALPKAILIASSMSLVACGGNTNNPDDNNTQSGLSGVQITKSNFEGAQHGCTNGGVEIIYGLDENTNGQLDSSEQKTDYVCHGNPGTSGKSAYDIWVEAGNTGDEAAFLASLKGDAGDLGTGGKSAYDIWIEAGNTGDEAAFLASLKGNAGEIGTAGMSAFDIWIEAGNSGTEADFLASLQGEQGEQGNQGDPGMMGSDGLNALVDVVVVTDDFNTCDTNYIASIYTGMDENHNTLLDEDERNENPKTLCVSDLSDPQLTSDDEREVVDTNLDKWTFSGHVSDDTAIKSLVLNINDKEINIDVLANGNYAYTTILSEGVNEYTVTATDLADKTGSYSGKVTVKANTDLDIQTDQDYSDLRILSDSSNWTFSGTNAGTFTDLYVMINDEVTPLQVAEDGTYSYEASLKAGHNLFTIMGTEITDDQSVKFTELNGAIYSGHKVAAGGSHSGALKDNKLYSWGRNNYAQTGLGYSSKLSDEDLGTHPITPMLVSSSVDKNFTSISFNQNYSLALDTNGEVWSWGYNDKGELGRGEVAEDCSPSGSKACGKEPGKTNLTDIVQISAGYSHALALKSDGSVWAWGTAGDGELGNNLTDDSNVPVETLLDSKLDIVQVSAGSDFSCAVEAMGSVWCWGKNNYGQMGQGDPEATDDQLTPIKVGLPEGTAIKSIATGKGHILALTEDGDVYGWGLNASSQIGYNGYQFKDTDYAWDRYVFTPTLILKHDESNPIKEVYANGNSSYIVTAEQKIYPWGQYGETTAEGKQDYNNLDYPEDKYGQIEDIKEVAAGALHLVAMQQDDTVFTFRWSFEGSLGGGDTTSNIWFYNYPIMPSFPEE